MEFRLLGAFELVAGGRSLDLGPAKQRVLFASLAVDAGHPVPTETLIDRIWDDAPPREPRKVLHTYVARSRRVLEQARHLDHGQTALERRADGYQLTMDLDRIDLHRFRRLVEQARAPRRHRPERAALLGEAVGLWRASPLDGMAGEWAARVREGLRQQRLGALTDWAEAELALGRHAPVIERLEELIVHYPLAESLAARLIQALSLAGRDAEALEVYSRACRRIDDELGAQPGPELRALHTAILRGEAVTLAADAPVLAVRRPVHHEMSSRPQPAQLPAQVPAFAGRTGYLKRLDAMLGSDDQGRIQVSVIAGVAGVGKTALALHWAHRVRHRFGDGQLYVNLRGFDPSGSHLGTAEALAGFLDALGVPPDRVPPDPDGQAGLYRSLLAERRMLVVLDNARDAEQVRPLLPGTPGCLVVVTSRSQLSGLVAAEGAHPLRLDPLPAAEARELLVHRVGPARAAAEPDAVAEIIARCAGLPLALAIVAARAATHPEFPLSAPAGELRDARNRLDALAGQDPATDPRAVFSWSYQALSPAAARLFRLLGVLPGPDIALPAAASLAGVAVPEARPLLAELAGAHLVAEHQPGRYALHDLLRAYAAELVHALDTEDDRRQASRRSLDHYLHTAHAATLLLAPRRRPIALPPPAPGVSAEAIDGAEQALAWFTAEHPALLAAVQEAAAQGHDEEVRHLAWALSAFLRWRGLLLDWVTAEQAALDASRRLADPRGQAHAHRHLGRAFTLLARFDRAHGHAAQALDLAVGLADRPGQAHAHHELTWALSRQGRYADALHHAEQALDLFRAAGHRPGHAKALNGVGYCHALLGRHDRALVYCRRARTLFQELGDLNGQAASLDGLGYAHHHLGQYDHALRCHRQALDLYLTLGDRIGEVEALIRLGNAHHVGGDHDTARDTWRQALVLLDELAHPDAGHVRAQLADPALHRTTPSDPAGTRLYWPHR
ncbi:BTAD domain-containing putative transcriptional regulator [Nonomuraea monospora]|uniref:BTAD domain-containing putative transcriptional regulator n=1 Tax=Nonomuraea monospora TaxID=568818 RepID=A0ABP5PVH5_9ACTN